jgi:hypothetical protein
MRGEHDRPTRHAHIFSWRHDPHHLALTGRYVAMGSSFASGAGIGPDISNGCERSAHNYPNQLADQLGLELIDVTCGGATTANLISSPHGDHPPQLAAVTVDTRLATITAGGNDLGCTAATLICLGAAQHGQPCTQIPTAEQTTQSAAALRTDPVMLLKAVASAAPHAQIYVVGYPRVFPDAPASCAGNIISAADSGRLAARGDRGCRR